MGSGDLNSAPCSCTASRLLTESLARAVSCFLIHSAGLYLPHEVLLITHYVQTEFDTSLQLFLTCHQHSPYPALWHIVQCSVTGQQDGSSCYSSYFPIEIESRLMNDINIVITFSYDTNQHQCGANDSFIAIFFTFIRSLSESMILISVKSKLISQLI